ncbi:MAG: YciI family protein [Bauldia sp.]|nr:YciI family protein [Bauldia sp.]
MRFMVIVKATKDSEAGVRPSEARFEAMARYNEELIKAGVMLDGAGLKPTSQGARIRFEGDTRTVIDGPFTESKELIAGYWIFEAKSKEEAIEWARRCPNPYDGDGEIEIRPFYELEDFGESAAINHHRANERALGGEA